MCTTFNNIPGMSYKTFKTNQLKKKTELVYYFYRSWPLKADNETKYDAKSTLQ